MNIVSRSKCGTANRFLVVSEGFPLEVEKVPPGEMLRIERLPLVGNKVLEGLFPFYEEPAKKSASDDDPNACLDRLFPLVEAEVEKATDDPAEGNPDNVVLDSVFPW